MTIREMRMERDSRSAGEPTPVGDKQTMLRNNQYELERDMDGLQGALRALAVLVGSNSNNRDIDPSDFEFLFNLLIERADVIRDHISFGRRTLFDG